MHILRDEGGGNRQATLLVAKWGGGERQQGMASRWENTDTSLSAYLILLEAFIFLSGTA